MAQALLSLRQKGVGKTAVLMRLYNDLFTKQDDVVPFFLTFAPYKGPAENFSHQSRKIYNDSIREFF